MSALPGTHASARPRAGRIAFRFLRGRGRTLAALALALALAVTACRPHAAARTQEPPVSRPPITEVLVRHTPAWMALPGVVGTYEGADAAGAPVIVVMLAREDAAVRARIPALVEGWPVRVEVTGEVKAFGDSAR